jgi:hypothetical protein
MFPGGMMGHIIIIINQMKQRSNAEGWRKLNASVFVCGEFCVFNPLVSCV